MKSIVFIIALAAGLVLAGNACATNQNYGSAEKKPQPVPVPETILAADEFPVDRNLEILLQKLIDPDAFVRVEAVQALGDIEKEQSLAAVCDCLGDENLYVRAYAAEALGKIGQVDISLTLSRLLPALDDPSPFVRSMMLVTLGELQDDRAADSIRKLLHDEDESVRGMAAWALNKIEKQQ